MRLRLIAAFVALFVAATSSTVTAAAPTARRPTVDRVNFGGGELVLGGIIYDHGTPAHWRFQWGLTEAYGHIARNIGGVRRGDRQYVDGRFNVQLNTTYYFRLVAFNSGGRTVSRGYHFSTD